MLAKLKQSINTMLILIEVSNIKRTYNLNSACYVFVQCIICSLGGALPKKVRRRRTKTEESGSDSMEFSK